VPIERPSTVPLCRFWPEGRLRRLRWKFYSDMLRLTSARQRHANLALSETIAGACLCWSVRQERLLGKPFLSLGLRFEPLALVVGVSSTS
jgi:hypothetical protein